MDKLRHDLLAVVRAGLAAVDAGRLVRDAMAAPDVMAAFNAARAVDVVAAGKAAAAMLAAGVAAAPVPLRQIVGAAAEVPAALPPGVRWHTTIHPVPDDRSMVAARDALAVAGAAGEEDLLVVLL